MNKWLALISMVVLSVGVTGISYARQHVVATESGLVYEDVEIGTGATAEAGKIVVIHLTGWLDDQGQKGEEFISSREVGEPVSFRLGTKMIIPGWNMGVDGMKVGGKRTLMIPASLAFGAKGIDEMVPPNADLIFDVELLDVR
jgi:FKBP-type peptidyl-prolyl cis-trans isomerase